MDALYAVTVGACLVGLIFAVMLVLAMYKHINKLLNEKTVGALVIDEEYDVMWLEIDKDKANIIKSKSEIMLRIDILPKRENEKNTRYNEIPLIKTKEEAQ